MSRNRGLLHINKLEDFAAWAASRGYVREDTKGVYEVLRLRYPGDPPAIFHKRDSAQEHVTTFGQGRRLVHNWLNDREQSSVSRDGETND